MNANGLKVLCLDGGGVKGYTSLLILKRIFRTMISEGSLAEEPKPCDIFDLIVGTSTGGLIAVMLGRLRMTIDECLLEFERTGEVVFGKSISSSKLGKLFKGASGSTFYDIDKLQEQIKESVVAHGQDKDQSFREENPTCKVIVCVTRLANSRSDLLRNYLAVHPTEENYDCTIWEAASATAAAPLYFKSVTFTKTGEQFGDGGMKRNNPINEAINEINRLKEKEWAGREIRCVISIGTGAVKARKLSNQLPELLKGIVAMMTDSEDIAQQFITCELGQSLHKSERYFRFNVPQELQMLGMDEWKETEKMKASTTDYLRQYHSGNTVKSCAQALLSPSKNLDKHAQSKPSLLLDRPCIYFIQRQNYITKIQSFFHSFDGGSQIFVLSGMAGVGKTQLALHFAELSKSSLSVFWVRADDWVNFAKDFSQILRVAFSAEMETQIPGEGILMQTREMLESKASEWILFLDNADDLQKFRENIQKYIPRKGRILLTTRDRRFQGSIAAATNGLYIKPMNDEEAMNLLRKSVPTELLNTTASEENMQQIVQTVGNLPLAIAQAAANIVEHDTPVEQFAAFVTKQSEVTAQLTEPMRDFMSTDERNSIQSVTTTWTMSISSLKASNPSSITILGYLSCFSNISIPYHLLRSLPEFNDMDEMEFIRSFGKLHQLCLAERVSEDTKPAAQMHPLVHEFAWKTICSGDPQRWLKPTVDLLSDLFSFVVHERDPDWKLCTYFAPHALRMAQLGQEHRSVTESSFALMQCLGSYLNACGENQLSYEFASAALDMATNLWGPKSLNTLQVMRLKIACLDSSFRHQEALQLLEEGLDCLDTVAADDSLSTLECLEQRYGLTYQKCNILRRDFKFEAVISAEHDILKILDEGKQTWIDQSEEPSQTLCKPSEMSLFVREMKNLAANQKRNSLYNDHRMNIAEVLGCLGRREESLQMTESLLAELAPDGVYENSMTKFYLCLLTLKARMTQVENPLAAFEIFLTIFNKSLSALGIEDRVTWFALNDIVRIKYFEDHQKEIAVVWNDLLDAALKPGAQLPRSSKMVEHLVIMALSLSCADDWIAHLICENEPEMVEDFSQKLQCVKRDFARGIDISSYTRHSKSAAMYNRGLYFQQRGRFGEAEQLYKSAITIAEAEENDDIIISGHYGIMLCVARRGRLDEARTYRSQHLNLIAKAEDIYETLEALMERDQNDKAIYEEAADRIARGESRDNGIWWEENKEELRCAELRYGKLERPPRPVTENDKIGTEPQQRGKNRFGVRRLLKRLGQSTVPKS